MLRSGRRWQQARRPSCRLPASLCRLCSVDSWILAPIRLASIVPGLSPGHGVSSSISRGEPQEATCVLTTLKVVADHNHVCVCIALISQARAGCAQPPPDSSIWQPDYSWQVTLGSTICRCFNQKFQDFSTRFGQLLTGCHRNYARTKLFLRGE